MKRTTQSKRNLQSLQWRRCERPAAASGVTAVFQQPEEFIDLYLAGCRAHCVMQKGL